MKVYNKILTGLLMSVMAWTLAGCDDFFETNPANVLNEKDYIEKEADMYSGYLGIQTLMQEAGDQAIWLTDLRTGYLQTTGNAPVALQNINNYVSTDGNEYADPTCYYAIIVACNDFIYKMNEFHAEVKGALSDSAKVHIPKLISGALRYKVWAYLTLGRIYGEAYWFDTNVTEVKELSGKEFEHCNMEELCTRCIDLLENGYYACGQQVPGNLKMDWRTWVNPVNPNADYDFWKYMSVDYTALLCDLYSWRASYTDSQNDWFRLRELALDFLANAPVTTDADDGTGRWKYYMCTKQTMMNYSEIFYTERIGWVPEPVSVIFYDYKNHQTNRLVQYLCPNYPTDGYYCRPSDYALDGMFSTADIRSAAQRFLISTINNQPALSKYYYSRLTDVNGGYIRAKIYEIEPSILLYRGFDFYYWLAEAENHLGHWDVARSLLNNGVGGRFSGAVTQSEASGYVNNYFPKDSLDNLPLWDPRYANLLVTSTGHSYPNIGLCGCLGATQYELPTLGDDASDSEKRAFAYSKERMRQYDLALAEEYQREFTAEGKAYSYMVKMAERYGHDSSIIYDLVKGKYLKQGDAAQVKSSLANKYFIDWKL